MNGVVSGCFCGCSRRLDCFSRFNGVPPLPPHTIESPRFTSSYGLESDAGLTVLSELLSFFCRWLIDPPSSEMYSRPLTWLGGVEEAGGRLICLVKIEFLSIIVVSRVISLRVSFVNPSPNAEVKDRIKGEASWPPLGLL